MISGKSSRNEKEGMVVSNFYKVGDHNVNQIFL